MTVISSLLRHVPLAWYESFGQGRFKIFLGPTKKGEGLYSLVPKKKRKSCNVGIYIPHMSDTKSDIRSNFCRLNGEAPVLKERGTCISEVRLSKFLIHGHPLSNNAMASVHRNLEPYNLQKL